MSPESPKSPELDSRIPGPRESGKSGISIDTGLRTPPDSGHVRILLSEAASAALLEAGTFFAVIQRGQYPEHDGNRMVLHLLPCDYSTASAAVEVAMGRRKPGRRCDIAP